MNHDKKQLKDFLDQKVDFYNQPLFISTDPISIPHLFKKKQDIEIAGFFAAIFAWGNRTTIISKTRDLMQRMAFAPYDFVQNHSASDLFKLHGFRHRTFNDDDLFCFIDFLKRHFQMNQSLETAFFPCDDMTTEQALIHFKNYFFSYEHLKRTEKHISSPVQKSTCKRLNMFLRWMIRNDNRGVDFGIWKKISPAQLICPIDLHVARVARRLNLLTRKLTDWQAAIELTDYLRTLDPHDPVKYDFALFGLGAIESVR